MGSILLGSSRSFKTNPLQCKAIEFWIGEAFPKKKSDWVPVCRPADYQPEQAIILVKPSSVKINSNLVKCIVLTKEVHLKISRLRTLPSQHPVGSPFSGCRHKTSSTGSNRGPNPEEHRSSFQTEDIPPR